MSTIASQLATPRIAIVIPCYNAATWIDKTINTVLSQNYPDLVIFVVDDGSRDQTVQIVRRYADRVWLESGPNRGACHARNRGTALAHQADAAYIIYLDADDYFEGPILWHAGKLAAETGADVVLSKNPMEFPDGQRIVRGAYLSCYGPIAPEVVFSGWLQGSFFNPSAIMWKLSFVDRIGGWDESVLLSQDTDFSLRAMLLLPDIRQNPHGNAVYRKGVSSSISAQTNARALASKLKVFVSLAERVKGTTFEGAMPLLTASIHLVIWQAYSAGHYRLGRQGLKHVARLSSQRHKAIGVLALLAKIARFEMKFRLKRHEP